MVNTNVEIYLEIITGQQAVYAILMQFTWGIALTFLGQLILRVGIKKLVIAGG